MSTPEINDQPEVTIVSKPKGMMQKIALFSAYTFFVLAVVSGVFLFIMAQKLGTSDPITASFLASFFFCIFTGVVLYIMGSANLPSLNFDEPASKID